MEEPVILLPKLGAKSSHIFTYLPKNITVVCGIDCLACQDEFFMKNTLDVEESDDHTPGFSLGLSCLFLV
jgi:hypothetical protein